MIDLRKAKTFAVRAFAAFFSILLLAPWASAKEPSRIQVYGGYSLLHPNLPAFDSDPAVSRTVESLLGNLSGWNGGIAVFAASVGGGLDVRVAERVAIRAAQLDYYPFRTSEGGGLTFNNFRFGAGVVFYLR